MSVSRVAFACATALTLGLGLTPLPGWSQIQSYPDMGPLSRYMMADRRAEIDLARSAMPASIAKNATVLVFTTHGYETAISGSNGFTCIVERAWMKPFDDPEFWNFHARLPTCYNPQASRTVLPYTIYRTKLVLAGVGKTELLQRLTAAIAAGQLPTPEPGNVAYMLSKRQYITDGTGKGATHAWRPHLMFYTPKENRAGAGASWGAALPGSPVVFNYWNKIQPEPWAQFFVPVTRWSDGSPGPQ